MPTVILRHAGLPLCAAAFALGFENIRARPAETVRNLVVAGKATLPPGVACAFGVLLRVAFFAERAAVLEAVTGLTNAAPRDHCISHARLCDEMQLWHGHRGLRRDIVAPSQNCDESNDHRLEHSKHRPRLSAASQTYPHNQILPPLAFADNEPRRNKRQ